MHLIRIGERFEALQPGCCPYIHGSNFNRSGKMPSQFMTDDFEAWPAVRTGCPRFVYLEIGCDKSGSLQSFVADANCQKIILLNSHLPEYAAVRGPEPHLENTTAAMLGGLTKIPRGRRWIESNPSFYRFLRPIHPLFPRFWLKHDFNPI